MSTPQEWIDAHPCSLCGKPLNAPHGRKRENAAYVSFTVHTSAGDKNAHGWANARRYPTRAALHIGLCCLGRVL